MVIGVLQLSDDGKTLKRVLDLSVKSVTIPGSVTKIGSNAFQYCNHLEAIDIPDSVTEIGAGAFYECNNLKSIVKALIFLIL